MTGLTQVNQNHVQIKYNVLTFPKKEIQKKKSTEIRSILSSLPLSSSKMRSVKFGLIHCLNSVDQIVSIRAEHVAKRSELIVSFLQLSDALEKAIQTLVKCISDNEEQSSGSELGDPIGESVSASTPIA
ncbi:hypothetical protein FQA39_LY18236 [Lamprigera yunnana]|nr:hypothetical protein FQA39_LY18236 [Lamprigera yunnana]